MISIGVYKIEHVASGKFYVGHSINLRARLLVHLSMLRGLKHHCKHLQRAWIKYGEDEFRFSVITKCQSQVEANNLEQSLIDEHFQSGVLFNTLPTNHPLESLNAARAIARTAQSQAKRVQTTKANGTFCAGQRRRVRSACQSTGVIETYESLSVAARLTGTSKGNISAVCNGLRLLAGGRSFWFALEAEKVAA